MGLGDNIKVARLAKGMSLDDLAKATGITKQAICAFENNRKFPKSSTLLAIKRELAVSLDYLMSDEGASVQAACTREVTRATTSERERRLSASTMQESE